MYKNAYMHGRLCTNTHKIPICVIDFFSSSFVVTCIKVLPTSTKRFLHFCSTHFWDFGCTDEAATIDICSHSCSSHTHSCSYTYSMHAICKEEEAVGVVEFVHAPSLWPGTGKSRSSEPSRSCSCSVRAEGLSHRRWWLYAHTVPAHTIEN